MFGLCPLPYTMIVGLTLDVQSTVLYICPFKSADLAYSQASFKEKQYLQASAGGLSF